VRCFGANDSGQILPAAPGGNLPITDAIWVPGATEVAVGIAHACAADGSLVVCWGANGQNQLGSIDPGPGPYSTAVGPVAQLALGGHNSCIVQGGNLSCWGNNNFGQLATDPAVTPTLAVPTTMPVPDVAEVAVGRTHWCARTNPGAIFCVGRGDAGQLGNGAAADSATPVMVSWPIEAGLPVSIVAGEQHQCVIDDAGALWCWGSNAFGQLMLEPDATGFDGYTTLPVRIALDDAVLAVAAGGTHTCALTEAAQLLCWGTNSQGQIGDGTTNYAFEPQPVALSCPSVGG
jgi:alpha-tubulin suppressor-like RCC1 family protein